MVEGADETLTPIFDPTNATNKAVTWESSNTSVATVGNDGKVTAVSVGTATITVTTTDGSKTATCEVTVTCSHNIVEVSAKDATCTEDGNIAHYKCTKCEKLFEDALGATEITDASSVVISATHTLTLVSEVPATCTENGVMAHYKCDVCNKLFSDTTGTQEVQANELVIPAGHNIVKVDAKAPTCIADGNIVHYKCTKCGKLFEDGQGVSEITDISSVVLAKTEHNWSTKWSSDDTHHWHECADCGTVKDKATHTPGAQATQTTPQTCTVCGHIITPIISAKPEIINDESQPDTWTPKSTGGLAFRSTAELADFISVSVNGKIVDRENYTLTEGSTIVTLKPEFLATLPDGKYTIEINSTTGVAKTVFTVEDSPVAKGSSPYANPNTGDTTKIISSIALLTLSGAGAVFFKKKREE